MSTFDEDNRLQWVERISRLMDSQFQVPGTTWRFGLDPLMGLIPVVGGLPSLAISGVLILTMMRHGASGQLVVRMLLNVLLDTIIGAIPVIGNIFDFAYKANDRNVRLLRAHYAEGKYQGSGWGLLVLVLVVLLALGGLVVWGVWELGTTIWHYLDQHSWQYA
ncbi:DUF4112 domain-containing protein [Hymenobacter taeanensis]|uniref:DUF4112 domain-containing protein n=1 Tax=Hymenobacter taeanensis TaxID=2735321 RepID=A0A6M6BJW7_9BACT|nr:MULTISPECIES: DUF4112 domain-containing protein [Hymenobacter]QJX48871.1 DUF4112 domain-containing protein [Hymenobacter taeanensis]UOQ81617.1 DUF4112 domain-containing protein [Hymenobacter sp. 5414T-23]